MSSLALKPYSIGEIINTIEPLVHVLSDRYKNIYCDYCLTKNNWLKSCSHCKKMYYCDHNCQQKDWKHHKMECDIYNKFDLSQIDNGNEEQWISNENKSLFRISMRLWLLVKSDSSMY